MKRLLFVLLLLPVSALAQKPTVIVSGDGSATVVSVGTQGPEGPPGNIPAGGSEGQGACKSGSGLGWCQTLFCTGTGCTVTGSETQNATINTIVQPTLDAALGVNSLGFYDVTFTGVKDPITWWGYNRTGGPASHPRFYAQFEGFYHNGPGGFDWSEFYLEKRDAGGATYRPFAVGTYDAHAEVVFAADSVAFNSRVGAGSLQINPGSSILQYTNVPFLVLGNNWWPYKQARAAGGGVYYGLIGLNASDKVMIDEVGLGIVAGGPLTLLSRTLATLGTPPNGTLIYCSDCTKTDPCAGGGTGAFASRVNSAWSCAAGGGSVWGDITGTLADQTDLGTALAGKCSLGGCTMTAPILGATGCTNPQFGFTGDADAGVCLTSLNNLRIQSSPLAASNSNMDVGDLGIQMTFRNASNQSTGWSIGDSFISFTPLTEPSVNFAHGAYRFGATANHDPIQIVPSAIGAGSFTGSIGSADLTGDRTWTLPNVGGNVALEPAGTGFFVMTAAGVQPTARSFTSTDGSIVIANPAGLAGNTDLSADFSQIQRYQTGTADPAGACQPGTTFIRTDTNKVWECTNDGADTWTWLHSGTLPVANGGTGLTTGTSGGVLGFTAAGTIASSAALTANLPVIGGGAGATPTVGTRSGNTTAFVTTTGTQTSGDCVTIDANGNHVAAGAACGSSSAFNPITTYDFYEDFSGGGTTSGTVGSNGLGWVNLGAPSGNTLTIGNGTEDNPAIATITTGTVDNTGIVMYFSTPTTAMATTRTMRRWLMEGVILLGTTSDLTSDVFWIGYTASGSGMLTTPGFVGIRRDTDLGDTNPVFVICDSATTGCQSAGDDTNQESAVSTITVADDGVYYFKIIIDQDDGPGSTRKVYMQINNETPVTFCSSGCTDTVAQFPTAILSPVFVHAARATTSKAHSLDFIHVRAEGLVRYTP
jgi:hypothetical protein